MSIVEWFNVGEGCFWIALGVGLGLACHLRGIPGARRALIGVLCLLLAAFGVSDFVEVRTGAWWRPWWLLAWKTACVIGIAATLVALKRGGAARQATGGERGPPAGR